MDKKEWEVRYKENSPQETVERIIGLLDNIGLETQYETFGTDVKCYSSRVSLKNEGLYDIGSNGKGTGAEFCKASAYAELMERIQNRIFFAQPRYDSTYRDIYKKIYPLYTVRGEYQPACMSELKKKLAATAKPMPLFGKTAEDVVDDLLEKMTFGKEEGFGTVPFYALKAQETVYLPEDIIKYFTGSNGMAAGNTLEEAIVQGLSEIFERYVQLQMIEKKIVPPEIPREVVASFPLVASIIEEIEKNRRYRTFVMDCSLGRGLPVVCGGVIDTENQTLGLKFGSHPDLGVALERIFSEAMQGKPLDIFVQMNVPNYTMPSQDSMYRHHNSFNMLKMGFGDVPAWLLYDEPSYSFTPWQEVEGMSNNQLMHSMLSLLDGMCSEVYIRDVSYLGFPTVWIYAPGVSEMLEMDIYNLKLNIMRTKLQRIFSHLDTATDEEVQQILRCAIAQSNALGENTINMLSGIAFVDKMPFSQFSEAAFLAAVCFYRLGNLKNAADMLRSFTNLTGYDFAASSYLKARAQGAVHSEVAQVLGKLCKPEIANKVLDDFADPQAVLSKVYPVCHGLHCDKCDTPCNYSSIEDFYINMIKLEIDSGLGTENLVKLFNK